MNRIKLQLSEEESVLATNPSVILTKNRVLSKMMELLGTVSAEQLELAKSSQERLPEEFFRLPPKISRGEQYLQLPWMVLDFPRNFQEPDLLVIRQFFWWGKLFSSTLIVGGKQRKILLNKDWRSMDDLYICVHPSPWEHHFEANNAQPVKLLSEDALRELLNRDFIKLAFMLPIENWQQAPEFYIRSFSRWMQLLVQS